MQVYDSIPTAYTFYASTYCDTEKGRRRSQQLNLQNVSRGPYLCPKHTRCHSCGSTVPGSGLSTRYLKLLL
ncbi:hypothetical protein BHE74_00020205 [Ensete ventricosum]|nr:hypothetical protein BHE74_00020205 [Ensete ventricosum]